MIASVEQLAVFFLNIFSDDVSGFAVSLVIVQRRKRSNFITKFFLSKSSIRELQPQMVFI